MGELLSGQMTAIGGPVLLVLLALSIAASATTISKTMQFSRMGVGRRRGIDAVMRAWGAGDAEGALRTAQAERSVLCRVAAEAIGSLAVRPGDTDRARELATAAGLRLLDAMQRHMRVIESTVQAAPMLGLLGTVLGMIAAFSELSASGGSVDPTQLAGGIWIALTTTALGLMIAIPFFFVSGWFEGRIERERSAMEAAIMTIVSEGRTADVPSAADYTSYWNQRREQAGGTVVRTG